MKLSVMRMGHRPARDERLTTHFCLVARALGAQEVLVTSSDESLKERVDAVTQHFGGDFTVRTGVKAHQQLRNWPGKVVHLTMYGQALGKMTPTLRHWIKEGTPILVVVGATKVPAYVYQEADLNVAVGHQPHSEVAALALMLDRLNPCWEECDPVGETTVSDSVSGKVVGSVPGPDECLVLLESSKVPPWVVEHSRMVAELAVRLARQVKGARVGMVEAGAWLHDWGRADSSGVDHCYFGARRARQAGHNPDLQHIIASHVGAGLTRAEARRLGMPPGDYLPRTLEARLVAACDNLVYGSQRRTLNECTRDLQRKGLYAAVKRVTRLHRQLSRLAGMDLDQL